MGGGPRAGALNYSKVLKLPNVVQLVGGVNRLRTFFHKVASASINLDQNVVYAGRPSHPQRWRRAGCGGNNPALCPAILYLFYPNDLRLLMP
jgi:hypothetical protein